MFGRRSTIGLALLCAFAFCAFAAQSAMAQKGTKAVNTTAVTCVFEGGEEEFEDAHCDEEGPLGKYGHVPISNDTTTEIDVTTDKTKDTPEKPTSDSTTSILKGTLAGVNTEVTCTKVASATKEGKSLSDIHNVETEAGSKKHTVTGTVLVNFTGCKVEKPKKCLIEEPIVTTASFAGVEGLISPGGGKEEMGLEFVGEGEKETFAEIKFIDDPADKGCSLLNGGKAFKVKGSVIATSNVAPTKANKHTGATTVYIPNKEKEAKPEEEMQTLEIGLKPAYFSGTFTTTMFGGGNPIALTTVT